MAGQQLDGLIRLNKASCRVGPSKAVPAHLRAHVTEVTAVKVPKAYRKQGQATALMHYVCAMADKSLTILLIYAQPFGDSPMDAAELERWYCERFGFQRIQDDPPLLARGIGATPQTHLTPVSKAINGHAIAEGI